jgi:NNP family nitrate/nitrite transporter-like MFS transporter
MEKNKTEKHFPFGSIFILTAGFFVSFLSRILLSPLLVNVEAEFGLQHDKAGALFLLISIGNTVSTLGSIFIAARFTHRRILIASSFLAGLSLFAISIGRQEFLLIIGLVFLGISTGLYLPSSIASLTEMVDSTSWGKAVAIHELAPNLAYISAPLLALILLPHVGWRGIFFILCLLAIAVSLLLTRFNRGNFLADPPSRSIFREVLSIPYFWVMVGLFSLGVGGNIGLYTMLPLFLTAGQGFQSSWVNALIPLTRLICLIVSFGSGYLSDRFGPWKTLITILIGSGISITLLGLISGAQLLPLLFIQPIWAVAFFPPAFAALSSLGSDSRRNFFVSLVIPLAFLAGNGVVPTAIGIFGQAGNFSMGFELLGLFTLSAGFLLAISRRLSAPSKIKIKSM